MRLKRCFTYGAITTSPFQGGRATSSRRGWNIGKCKFGRLRNGCDSERSTNKKSFGEVHVDGINVDMDETVDLNRLMSIKEVGD